MPHTILAEVTASVSELKKNPMGTVAAGKGFPVAILNCNELALLEQFQQKCIAVLRQELRKNKEIEHFRASGKSENALLRAPPRPSTP